MQIYSNKLAANLKQSLSPIYLVAGDDILLQNEACDEIREACSKKGYDERERFNFETGFDWQSWNESCNALSLFSNQRIIELRLPSSKIGTAGSEAISRYCENPSQDTIVLIISARIEGNPKWVKAATQTGVYVPIYPLDNNQLPSWLKQRAQKNNLTLAHDAAELLAERVEGNLMAAAQELDKLALLYYPRTAPLIAHRLVKLLLTVRDSLRLILLIMRLMVMRRVLAERYGIYKKKVMSPQRLLRHWRIS